MNWKSRRCFKAIVTCSVAAVLGSLATVGNAGILVGIDSVFGPGSASVGLPPGAIVENDDVAGPSPNIVDVQKTFDEFGPLDIVFNVDNTTNSRATEYWFIETVTNNSGRTWRDFHIELGFGVGSDFVPSNDEDFLDFDQQHPPTSPPASDPFTRIELSDTGEFDDLIWFFDGEVLDGGTAMFLFPLDVSNFSLQMPESARTDTGYQFTLRQLPSDIIPEPTTWAIWSLLGALGLTVGWWRRKTSR